MEERFKTKDRELSKKGLTAGYKRAMFEAAAATAPSTAPGSLRSSHDGPLLAASAAGGPGVTAGAAAGGYYQMPGQLNSTAGLISLSALPDAAAGARRAAEQPHFSLQTGECAAGSQHPSLLLTGPPGSGLAAAAAAGSSMAAVPPGAQPLSVQIPEGAAAAGGHSAPSSASAAAPHYQPLQSFTGQAEIYAEWDKCLSVLQYGKHC